MLYTAACCSGMGQELEVGALAVFSALLSASFLTNVSSEGTSSGQEIRGHVI